MAKNVDNPAARDVARQAQQVKKSQKVSQSKNVMSTGVQARPTQFGQILKQQLSHSPLLRHQEPSESKQERPRERHSESRDSRATKETAQRQGGQQRERVQESRGRDESRDQSDSREEKGTSQKKDSSQHAKQAEQRVVAKQGRGQSRGVCSSSGGCGG